MDNENFNPSISITESPRKKSGGIVVKIAALLIILGVAGAGAALASRVWDPLWNPFRPAPEMVLAGMATRTKEIKTYHNKAIFTINLKNKDEFKIEGNFDGDGDASNPESPKTATKFNLSLAMEGMQFSLAGEAKTIDKSSYLNLTTIPALPMLEPFFALFGIDLQNLKNQWIKLEAQQSQTEKDKALAQKVEELITGKKFFQINQELPDEKINGIKSYHYKIAVNNEEIKKIIPELLKFAQESEKSPIPLGDIEDEFQTEINELLNNMGEITADVWIGKKDLYLYKIQLEKEIDAGAFEDGEEGTFAIKFTAEFSNFNKPIEITVPTESKTFQEIFTPQRGGLFGQTGLMTASKGRDIRRQTDLLQIRDILEFYYADNNSYPQSINFPPEAVLKKYYSTIPIDPGNGHCPGPYKWINNVGYPNKYCMYACLESGKYYAVSSNVSVRTGIMSSPPTNLDCK